MRGDLEGLSDELLADKLQVLGDARDELMLEMAAENPWTIDVFDHETNGEAALRHPAYYHLIGMVNWALLVFGLFFNTTGVNDFKKIRMKIMSCKILDITTELERRVKRKNDR